MRRRTKMRVLAVLVAMALPAVAADPDIANVAVNGGFERADADAPAHPAGWAVDIAQNAPAAPDYALQAAVVHGGRRALRVGYRNDQGYAGAAQRADASAVAGHRVRLGAWLRRDNARSVVGAWLLAKGAGGERLLYVNSYEQPMPRPGAWGRHDIVIDIPAAAASVAFGVAIHEHDGTLWTDDVTLVRETPAAP